MNLKRNFIWISLSVVSQCQIFCSPVQAESILAPPAKPFLEEFPELKDYLEEEAPSPIHFGVGLSPFTVMTNRLAAGFAPVELYWISPRLEIELLGIRYATTLTQNQPELKTSIYSIRTSPRFRVTQHLSVGVHAGIELLSFPNLKTRIRNGDKVTQFEPFSASGLIYGASLSQPFKLESGNMLIFSQTISFEKYKPLSAPSGWTREFDSDSISADPTPLNAGKVFMIEVSVLF